MGAPQTLVRWDAVARGNPFADAAGPGKAPASSPPPTQARVWLFGMLTTAGVERPLKLPLAPSAKLGDLLRELGARLDPESLGRMQDANGRLLPQCRVFVNGEPADRTDVALTGSRGHAEVEIIVLSAAEGG